MSPSPDHFASSKAVATCTAPATESRKNTAGKLIPKASAGAEGHGQDDPEALATGEQEPGDRSHEQAPERPGDYSHSIVPGGLDVMSSVTRLTCGSSLIMREATFSSRGYGSRAQSAVIASSLVTARIT